MSRKLWLFVVFATAAGTGCGTDLGECKDPSTLAYEELGDLNGDGVLSHDEYRWPGQRTIDETCAGGRCHSGLAQGEARQGAPAGLDFDAPQMGLANPDSKKDPRALASQGIANIRDMAGEIWHEISEGTMPPSSAVPMREQVRNWLACGAPAREPMVTGAGASFDTVFAAMSICLGCHSQAAPMGGFALGTELCSSYDALVNRPSAAGACGGRTYVVPFDPTNSLLLNKITATPVCGGSMPQFGTPLAEQNPTVYQAMESWIMDGAPKPDGCP